MLPFQSLIIVDKESNVPLYQQVSNKLASLIREGVIRPGAMLPGTREMSMMIGVHRKTVTTAYQDLYAQDWIEINPRKGPVVAERLPEIKPRTFDSLNHRSAYAGDPGFSFTSMPSHPAFNSRYKTYTQPIVAINDGFPDQRIAPMDVLLREYRRLFGEQIHKNIPRSDGQLGSLRLRKALAEFMADSRGLNIGPENILLTHGAQMAIYIAAQILVKPGSRVLVAATNYFLADAIFQQLKVDLIRIPVDEQGIDLECIAEICRDRPPDLLYIIPHHHHPTTVSLSTARRVQLLELIRRYNFPVIEDDYDYDFHYDGSPILPLASSDHQGNVIYIGSLAKALTTTVRCGYMIAPEKFVAEAGSIRTVIDIRNDYLLEDALAAIIRKGELQKHLKKALKIYHDRRDLLCELLESELNEVVSFRKPEGGMAVWVVFAPQYPLVKVAALAAKKGLQMNDGSIYNNGDNSINALRIGFSGLNEQEIKNVICILKEVTDKM
jgi:GntR family transcriptional regulator/MocR family aminotransferase